MKYFFDTEFIEARGHLELVSIGMEAGDGRQFYAESSEFSVSMANPFVLEHVLPKLKFWNNKDSIINKNEFHTCGNTLTEVYGTLDYIKTHLTLFIGPEKKPKFYSYYADYDWVLFCWIFGTMCDLPENFPMYCRDLKQMMSHYKVNSQPPKPANLHNALDDAIWHKQLYHHIHEQAKRRDCEEVTK